MSMNKWKNKNGGITLIELVITVVDLITKDGKTEKKINPEFRQFVKDMGTTIKTCKTRSPETKRKSGITK